jgi:hypothetical protein
VRPPSPAPAMAMRGVVMVPIKAYQLQKCNHYTFEVAQLAR